MIKVLDLFAGKQSVRKALEEIYGNHLEEISGEYKNGIGYAYQGDICDFINEPRKIIEYVGIDIYSPEGQNLHLDLTQDNIVDKLKEALPKDGKPDFIGASPVCNKLSLTTALIGGHNPFFKVDKVNETIEPGPIGSEGIGGRETYKAKFGSKEYYDDAVGTLKMFNNTKEIINYYNVPFAIENPTHSLTKYLMKEYIGNKCSYCQYGFTVRKNTTIYTNKTIKLNKCKGHVKGDHEYIHRNAINQAANLPNIKQYDQRAAVPNKLIKTIIKELLNDNN